MSQKRRNSLFGDSTPLSPLSLDLPPDSPPAQSIQELLLLSPSPPKRSGSKPPPEHPEAEEEPSPHRRSCKSCRASLLGCSSPRNACRTRRKVEPVVFWEDKDFGFGEEIGKASKRRRSGRTKKEKLILIPSVVASPIVLRERLSISLMKCTSLVKYL